jgi:charged multivesicular body protein 7
MKAYNTSAATLTSILTHPLLQMDSVDQTMENMSDALADYKEIEDAIKIGNEGALSAAGVEEVDDDELAEELKALVLEQQQDRQREAEAARVAEAQRRISDKTTDVPTSLDEMGQLTAQKLEGPSKSKGDLTEDWRVAYEKGEEERAAQVNP